VIVRISNEGQYELDEGNAQALQELDNRAIDQCAAGDEERFRATFAELLALVRAHGRPIPDDELVASDVILPPPDVSFEEAQTGFSGEGLIPG
jgi:PspAA-like protein